MCLKGKNCNVWGGYGEITVLQNLEDECLGDRVTFYIYFLSDRISCILPQIVRL